MSIATVSDKNRVSATVNSKQSVTGSVSGKASVTATANPTKFLKTSSVFNAQTHYDFPSVGDVNVIYKAESERRIYQWNPTELKYEILSEVPEYDLIHGGTADGTNT